MTRDDLKEHLQQLQLSSVEVRVTGEPYRFIGTVSSPDFEGQNEAIRQGKLWRHLLDRLTPEQLAEIEFVFTFTPQELAALDRGERPASWSPARGA